VFALHFFRCFPFFPHSFLPLQHVWLVSPSPCISLLHLLGALTLCYGVDDVVIVVDIGSDTVKAGYATDDHPKAKVPAKALCSLVCCLLFVMFGWCLVDADCVCVRAQDR
jgi:hypothetical protein